MPRQTYRYVLGEDGHYVSVPCRDVAVKEDLEALPYNERMLKMWHKLECNEGSDSRYRWYSQSPQQIKDAWARE